jgi:DNA polymerase-3 subunit epsilon
MYRLRWIWFGHCDHWWLYYVVLLHLLRRHRRALRMIRRACLVDTETTGLNPATDHVIEVAATIFNFEYNAPETIFSSLCFAETNAAEAINQIPVGLLLTAPPAEAVWAHVIKMASLCDIVIAHRAEFDRSFSSPEMQAMTWVCSKFDIEWPKGKLGDSLVPLALQHGISVHGAHRAATDVDIMCRLFARVGDMGADWETILRRAMRPKKLFYSLAPFEEKDIVKAHGFQWDPAKYGKNWARRMPIEDAEKLPFRVKQIGE